MTGRRRETTATFSGASSKRREAWSLLLAVLVAGAAHAQEVPSDGQPLAPASPAHEGFRLQPALDARMVYTNNAGPDEQTGQLHQELVMEVQPSVVFERRGPRLTLTGNLEGSYIDYQRGSHPGRWLPRGRVDLASKLVDNLLYLDAYARVDPTFEDPFAARAGESTSYKLEPRTRYFAAPYILKRFDEVTSLLVRGEFTRTRITDPTSTDSSKVNIDSHNSVARFERRPVPFGVEIEAKSRQESDGRVEEAVLKEDSGRLRLDYAINPQIIFGAIGGRERATFSTTEVTDSLYGGRVQLRPNQRTRVDLTLEKRYFGSGWDARVDHHSYLFSVSLQSSRTVTSQDISEFSTVAGETLGDALDRTLSSIADPIARGQLKDRIISSIGAPQVGSNNVLTYYSLSPQVRSNTAMNLSLHGRRNVVYVNYGYLKVQAVPELALLPQTSSDVLQQSAALGWNSRLTPLMTLNTAFELARTESISGGAGVEGTYVEQRTLRGEAVFALSPRASFTLGARRSQVSATRPMTAIDLYGERAVYLGVRQRF